MHCGGDAVWNDTPCPSCNKLPVDESVYPRKSWKKALFYCFAVGNFGVHRFYTGFRTVGWIQLATFGGCMVWCFLDLLQLMSGDYKDAFGRALIDDRNEKED